MDGQDWKKVTLKKPLTVAEKKARGQIDTTRKTTGLNSNSGKLTGAAAFKVDDAEVGKPIMVSKEIGDIIIATRLELKKTRKEMASLIGVSEGVLAGFENHNAVWNQGDADKIKSGFRRQGKNIDFKKPTA